jgi:hypothetical protein
MTSSAVQYTGRRQWFSGLRTQIMIPADLNDEQAVEFVGKALIERLGPCPAPSQELIEKFKRQSEAMADGDPEWLHA